jgi:hypothetical protein
LVLERNTKEASKSKRSMPAALKGSAQSFRTHINTRDDIYQRRSFA